eukprot:766064-Hanusia_phi.AAC.4
MTLPQEVKCGHEDAVSSLAVSSERTGPTLLASGSWDATVKTWSFLPNGLSSTPVSTGSQGGEVELSTTASHISVLRGSKQHGWSPPLLLLLVSQAACSLHGCRFLHPPPRRSSEVRNPSAAATAMTKFQLCGERWQAVGSRRCGRKADMGPPGREERTWNLPQSASYRGRSHHFSGREVDLFQSFMLHSGEGRWQQDSGRRRGECNQPMGHKICMITPAWVALV